MSTRSISFMMAGLAMSLAVGCAHERHQDIPMDTVRVQEGDGMLNWHATDDGKVFIQNMNENKIEWAGAVEEDQTISINPEADEITVGGQVVSSARLDNNDNRRIYFERDMTVRTKRTTIKTQTEVDDPPRIEKKTTIEHEPAVIEKRTTEETVVDPEVEVREEEITIEEED